jgi:acyl carrier protein
MAAGEETRWWLKQMGFEGLDPALAVHALGGLLEGSGTQTMLAKVDWSLFRPLYQGRRRRPFLDEIGEAVRAPARPATGHDEELRRLRTATAAEQREFLMAHVVREVNRLLGFDPERPVDPDLGFFKAGMDSIMTVQLRNRLETALGVKLPATVAFEYPTADALANYLVDALAAEAVPMGAPAVERKATPSPPTAQFSEEELTVLLAEKLNEMVPRPHVDASSRKES